MPCTKTSVYTKCKAIFSIALALDSGDAMVIRGSVSSFSFGEVCRPIRLIRCSQPHIHTHKMLSLWVPKTAIKSTRLARAALCKGELTQNVLSLSHSRVLNSYKWQTILGSSRLFSFVCWLRSTPCRERAPSTCTRLVPLCTSLFSCIPLDLLKALRPRDVGLPCSSMHFSATFWAGQVALPGWRRLQHLLPIASNRRVGCGVVECRNFLVWWLEDWRVGRIHWSFLGALQLF